MIFAVMEKGMNDMTHAEHLIENAIVDMEEHNGFEHFASKEHNKLMSELTGIKLSDVWAMAQHVVYSFKPDWLSDKEKEMENRYGYRLDQRDYLY